MEVLKNKLPIFFASLLFAQTAGSVGRETGLDDNDKLKRLVLAAEAGSAPAQYLLGRFRLEKASDSVAIQDAMTWLEKAAEQGHAEAAMSLGEVFYYGRKLPRNDQIALRWFERAVALNHAESMDYLGLVYYFGRDGVVRDCQKAAYWFDKGFLAGYTKSLNNLVWLWATCPERQFRDGKKAVEVGSMLLANSSEREPGTLDTVAAAYAEIGDFNMALQLQTEAISKLEPGANTGRHQGFVRRLEGYKAGKPWRGSSKEGGPEN